MKSASCLRDERGFTLIEAIIAVAVLIVGILAMYSMQLAAINGNSRSNYVTRAFSYASQQIEALSNTDYGDIQSFAGNSTGNLTIAHDNFYTISANVTDDQPMQDLKTVQVNVEYTVRGQNKKVTMDYVIPKS